MFIHTVFIIVICADKDNRGYDCEYQRLKETTQEQSLKTLTHEPIEWNE